MIRVFTFMGYADDAPYYMYGDEYANEGKENADKVLAEVKAICGQQAAIVGTEGDEVFGTPAYGSQAMGLLTTYIVHH